MGDGGVACMRLRQQQHNTTIMGDSSFGIQDKPLTTTATKTAAAATTTTSIPTTTATATAVGSGGGGGGNNNGSATNGNHKSAGNAGTSNGGNPKTRKIVKKVIKVRKVVRKVPKDPKKKELGELGKEATGGKEEAKRSTDSKVAENGGSASVVDGKVGSNENSGKDEVEEGELGTLKWPPPAKGGEIENGEFVPPEKLRRPEVEKGEIVGEKWRKGGVEKGDIIPVKLRKGEFGRDEIEKGEFIPDRWHHRDDYSYSKFRGRYDANRERTPPSSGKYSSEDFYRRKEFSRSGSSQHSRSSSRWESGLDRSMRISSKIVDEEGLFKAEYSNGKNHGRDYASSNRLKRHGADSDSSDRKHYGDYGDYAGSKSRRLSEDSTRSAHSEHYSRHSVERFHRNSSSSSSSSRVSSMDKHEKYGPRHPEPTLSSKIVYDRHGPSSGISERSPHDRARYHDYRDRSPVRRERSPFIAERTTYGRERSPYARRDKSPHYRDKSPYGRGKSPQGREKSPFGRDRSSPYDRSRHHDHREKSPDRSPQDRIRSHDGKDHSSNFLERSPLDQGRANSHREAARKGGASEKKNSQNDRKGLEDKHKDSNGRDLQCPAKESQDRSSVHDLTGLDNKSSNSESHKEEQSLSPSIGGKVSLDVDAPPPVELLSMEEDMDICDTPPHIPLVADSSLGKWFYLDYFGVERGPSKLCDLKALVDEGVLFSDHLIKHLDSDRWVTIENAVSPLVTLNFPSIVPDVVTQLVSPPEAPGNLLADNGDTGLSTALTGEEVPVTSLLELFCPEDSAGTAEPVEDVCIDERVGALMDGFTVIPGKELESIGDVLQRTFDFVEWEEWGKSDGMWDWAYATEQHEPDCDELSRYPGMKEADEVRSNVIPEEDNGFTYLGDTSDWFSVPWSCKGGDWKRNDEAVQDRFSRRKQVVNDGFPLCQMPKSGSEDPRCHRRDDLYYPSQSRRLDLPPWAFSCPDERNNVSKPPIMRGVRGSILPVVRINACVVKDQGSVVSEPRTKVRSKDRYSSRSGRSHSGANDGKRLTAEGDSQSRAVCDSHGYQKSTATINIPKDRVCTVEDLQLHLGEWYYFDGAGHEQGPLSFSELQALVDQGTIQKCSSVFRKLDRVWVPVSSTGVTSEMKGKTEQEHASETDESSVNYSKSCNTAGHESTGICSSFHIVYPQFIGYTRGKLHELVMKSFKSREFAAAINEVLDPWLNAKQPKKEIDKHIYRTSEIDVRGGRRARVWVDGDYEDNELEEDLEFVQKDETTFEELCGDATFVSDGSVHSESEMGSWDLLDGHMLARVFHFLRSDMKSLAFASLTCKHWRAAVRFYKGMSRQVNLSSMGPNCTDSMLLNILNGYHKEKINSMVLAGCTNVSSGMLEEILCSFPSLSYIDIRGCSQFTELALKFPKVCWLKSYSLGNVRMSEDSYSKIRSIKHISGKSNGIGSDADDFGELKGYFDSVSKRDSANQFRRSLYKRSKLFDARRSSSILSRDARVRQWAIKKSENSYKRTEGFLALGLKDIMKENIFEFFVPKVAKIEEKMKNGYYVTHGLRAVKEDISRMCRDAIKAKSRGAGDMNHVITLFLQLASRLEGSSKFSYEKDELMNSWKDDLSAGFGSASVRNKKKIVSEKRLMNRNNGTNGSFEFGEYASDREIRRKLSKLNRKSMDSGSETSDDFDRSSDEGMSDGESTDSDTESDSYFRSEGQTRDPSGDGYLLADEGLDSLTDEREWGARMTKASLVPPVTRKYEVVDQYVIVADEEDVRRKMSVSLPDDYAEKLDAQKNGTEELDMELPEVKEYKPRKQLGDQVIEQEVYGIDPYTHNLLLDSMPEELDWLLQDKQVFIEEVLLRTLNKQVRHFTGSGNTPMIYPLQPVIEEIERVAKEDCDIKKMKMCRGILKAIDSRPDDNYVAYRKGLGVVCNKEGGFGEDDFVVEFLGEVYPAWKWFEKQDGIRSLQNDSKDPAPEFYNIYLERPKGDADGYDLVVVDAMHKANYASRICHSCRPNCEAKVTAVNGEYQIGIYCVRGIQCGEEITFDYNSVTESKEEYEASVCLCGSQVCRGSYLNLTGEGAFQKVLKEWHGLLDRLQLMLEACELNSVSEEDYLDLGRAGLGSCLLGGLPDWVVAYSARLVRFINLERTKLPEEILRHNLEEKRKYFTDISIEVERSDAEVQLLLDPHIRSFCMRQAEGVYNQRLQNLAVTLDKVRYVMRCVFGDPKRAPPPLERLSPEETISFLWKGEGSLVEELIQSMAPHMEADMLNDLKSKIHVHDPSNSTDIQKELKKSLLWLRDEIRNLPCTFMSRHDAAADLIHIYAYTKCFFRIQDYAKFTSPPVYISPLDLGPKYADKLGPGLHEYRKTYGENYCLGQLIFWQLQTNTDPDCSLAKASRGCVSLPEMGSFYAKVQKPSQQRIYGPKIVKTMLERMEKYPQKPWPNDKLWSFKTSPKIIGSPMLDVVVNNTSLDREMVYWLKHRPSVAGLPWDT